MECCTTCLLQTAIQVSTVKEQLCCPLAGKGLNVLLRAAGLQGNVFQRC